MKAKLSKLTALLLTVLLVVSLAACGGDTKPTPTPAGNDPAGNTTPEPTEEVAPATDWTKFENWMAEDWSAKTVSYQFTGNWSLPENNFYYEFCINLYDDGSAAIDQRNTTAGSSYMMYGYWSEENTEDGNEITFDTLYVTSLNGTALEAHEYNYVLYEEADGGYSFGYDFGIIPGQYFRTVDVAGSSTATYATFDDFHAAVDVVLESYRFESAEASNDFEARISIFSNGTATCSLITEYNGAKTAVANGEATVTMVTNEAGDAVENYVIKGTHDAMGDFEITVPADYSGFPWAVSFMGVDFSFDMQPVEIPAE